MLNLSAPIFTALFTTASAGSVPSQTRRWLSYNVDDSSNWNGPTGFGGELPMELWPYAPASAKFHSKSVPDRGAWRAGAVVMSDGYQPGDGDLATTPYGWLCVQAGNGPGSTWPACTHSQPCWQPFGLALPPAPAPAPAPSASLAAQLQQLNEAREAGLISDVEHAQARQMALSSLVRPQRHL